MMCVSLVSPLAQGASGLRAWSAVLSGGELFGVLVSEAVSSAVLNSWPRAVWSGRWGWCTLPSAYPLRAIWLVGFLVCFVFRVFYFLRLEITKLNREGKKQTVTS